MGQLYDIELPGTFAFSGRLGALTGTIHLYARVSETTIVHVLRTLIQQGVKVEELCTIIRGEE